MDATPENGVRWGRTVLAGVAADVLIKATFFLIVLGHTFARSARVAGDQEAVERFAAALGVWIGTIGGPLVTCGVAWFIVRSIGHRLLVHGALVGAASATVALLINRLVFHLPVTLLMAVALAARVVGGLGGGWLAAFRVGPRRSL